MSFINLNWKRSNLFYYHPLKPSIFKTFVGFTTFLEMLKICAEFFYVMASGGLYSRIHINRSDQRSTTKPPRLDRNTCRVMKSEMLSKLKTQKGRFTVLKSFTAKLDNYYDQTEYMLTLQTLGSLSFCWLLWEALDW